MKFNSTISALILITFSSIVLADEDNRFKFNHGSSLEVITTTNGGKTNPSLSILGASSEVSKDTKWDSSTHLSSRPMLLINKNGNISEIGIDQMGGLKVLDINFAASLTMNGKKDQQNKGTVTQTEAAIGLGTSQDASTLIGGNLSTLTLNYQRSSLYDNGKQAECSGLGAGLRAAHVGETLVLDAKAAALFSDCFAKDSPELKKSISYIASIDAQLYLTPRFFAKGSIVYDGQVKDMQEVQDLQYETNPFKVTAGVGIAFGSAKSK